MKYIIMADGKGTRWDNYKYIPKHLIQFHGETLLARTVRLLHTYDSGCEVVITSHDPRYEVPGAVRYEPKHNILEIDRFTNELIADDVSFLYGDTFYSEASIKAIVKEPTEDLLFFGNENSIVAVKVKNAALFANHVEKVRNLFIEGKIKGCKGWHVYQSFQGLPFDQKQIAEKYIYLKDETEDFNSPEDYIRRRQNTDE